MIKMRSDDQATWGPQYAGLLLFHYELATDRLFCIREELPWMLFFHRSCFAIWFGFFSQKNILYVHSHFLLFCWCGVIFNHIHHGYSLHDVPRVSAEKVILPELYTAKPTANTKMVKGVIQKSMSSIYIFYSLINFKYQSRKLVIETKTVTVWGC